MKQYMLQNIRDALFWLMTSPFEVFSRLSAMRLCRDTITFSMNMKNLIFNWRNGHSSCSIEIEVLKNVNNEFFIIAIYNTFPFRSDCCVHWNCAITISQHLNYNNEIAHTLIKTLCKWKIGFSRVILYFFLFTYIAVAADDGIQSRCKPLFVADQKLPRKCIFRWWDIQKGENYYSVCWL